MNLVRSALVLLAVVAVHVPGRSLAADRLCDPAFEDCRAPLLALINNEKVGIDVAFWFMEDFRYAQALKAKHDAGVPVRVIMDSRATPIYPHSGPILDYFADETRIPLREKTSSGIVHWKMMLFAGQNTVQFSGANYSPHAFRPNDPYKDYIDEVIYFTEDPALVNSFKTKYDDVWTTTSGYRTYANPPASLERHYPTYPIDSRLNFPPFQSFRSRSVGRYRAESTAIDSIMFRITDLGHTNEIIARMNAGVPFRLITDRREYRDPGKLWNAYNVDLLYAAGAQIRINKHLGDLHQKSTILRGQRMVIFGSSNWTSPSSGSQLEHNIFTTAGWFYDWFSEQFDRKWNNRTGNEETQPFVPLPPDPPSYSQPANGASGLSQSVTLAWHAGYWAHLYDIYLGTSADPPLLAANVELGPSTSSSDLVRYTVQGLAPGTTYFWRIVSKTAAGVSRSGGTAWSFQTGGAPAPLPSGWQSRDIGNVGVAGSTTFSNGSFSVNGAGADIWGTSDAFHYAYRSLSGDGTIIARVASVSGSQAWTKVGVMVRGSTAANAAYALMLVSTGKGLAFQRRTADGASATHTSGGSGTAPRWVRLVRTGNTITASVSGNGTSWSTVGSDTFAMPSTALFGLAVTSQSTTQLASGVLDSVSVTSGGTTPPPTPLPSGWQSRDIGNVGVAGTASHENGTFTVQGAGTDVWGTSDQFHYAYRSLSGDGSIVARIASIDGSQAWTKMGVMMRSSTAVNAAYAFMLGSTGKGFAFQRRTSDGASATHTAGPSGGAPRWVALVRAGSRITAYVSSNGSSWSVVGSDTFAMGSTILVGLAAHSHTTSALATGVFDNVTVQTGSSTTELPEGWASRDIGTVGVGGEAFEEDGVFTVRGAGEDVWGTADAFHYASRELTGDGAIVARVASIDGSEAWTKVGVMIRDSAEPDAAYAFMLVSEAKGLAFQRRTAGGVEATHTAAGGGSAPAWVRLERTGNVIAAYVSSDGSSWTHVGSDAFAMTPGVLVGLATTSHDASRVATGTFDSVEVAGGES